MIGNHFFLYLNLKHNYLVLSPTYAIIPSFLSIHLVYVWSLKSDPLGRQCPHLKQDNCHSIGVSFFYFVVNIKIIYNIFFCGAQSTQAILSFFSLKPLEPELSQNTQNLDHLLPSDIYNVLCSFVSNQELH